MTEHLKTDTINIMPYMKFIPLPSNDFDRFIQTYYNKCRLYMPQIESIAGKWRFEDLLPGMSDFDTRFICTNGMTANDWCKMSMAVGEVHLKLCQLYPEWVRILEHLPGINITWDELTNETCYYPEYKQWSFYHCSQPNRLKQAQYRLANREWDSKDEYFHLKKFLYYYEPYNRSIDPGVNLGPYENRYPLHSRLMHYFTPPVQSAVSIINRKAIIGKMEALRLACDIFSQNEIFNEVIKIVQQNYEVSELYEEPALSELEQRLYDGLKLVATHLTKIITILPDSQNTNPEDWKLSLNEVSVSPSLVIFDNAKFARLMKGRLYFYTHAPVHFDSIWCIQTELQRIGNNFFRTPFSVFWKVFNGERIEDPADIVPALYPEILTKEEIRCTLVFNRLTYDGKWESGQEVNIARQIVDIFDGFFHALYKISEKAKELDSD